MRLRVQTFDDGEPFYVPTIPYATGSVLAIDVLTLGNQGQDGAPIPVPTPTQSAVRLRAPLSPVPGGCSNAG